jgi:very-short-patch-repair endonuclease
MIKKRDKLGRIVKTGKWVRCFNCSIFIYKQKRTLLFTKKYFCSHKCYLKWRKENPQTNFNWWNNNKLRKIIIKKMSIANKGKHLSLKTEIKKGQHLSFKTEIKPKEHKSPKTEFKKGHKSPNNSPIKKGHHFEFCNNQKRIAKSIKSNNRKTIPEKILHKILIKYFPNKFIYSGNGKIIIEFFVPDFVDIKNKKIIEVYGDYWHNRPKQKKKDYFRLIVYKRNGYKTLIIWEHELKKLTNIIIKIKKFIK